jgi:hypothetical protein
MMIFRTPTRLVGHQAPLENPIMALSFVPIIAGLRFAVGFPGRDLAALKPTSLFRSRLMCLGVGFMKFFECKGLFADKGLESGVERSGFGADHGLSADHRFGAFGGWITSRGFGLGEAEEFVPVEFDGFIGGFHGVFWVKNKFAVRR